MSAHFGRGDTLIRACGKDGAGLTTRMFSLVTCRACIHDVEEHGIGGMDKDESDCRSIRTNLNRRGARLAFRRATYRGTSGISLSGTDVAGRRTKIFARDWPEMMGLMLHGDLITAKATGSRPCEAYGTHTVGQWCPYHGNVPA